MSMTVEAAQAEIKAQVAQVGDSRGKEASKIRKTVTESLKELKGLKEQIERLENKETRSLREEKLLNKLKRKVGEIIAHVRGLVSDFLNGATVWFATKR